MPGTPIPPELSAARARFAELVQQHRPELHRFCARLVGSAIDGEDVVQDTLAKAFFQLSAASEQPPLEPWLFRIAYTTALDHLRRYDVRFVEPVADVADGALGDLGPTPDLVHAALGTFMQLPVSQRSAVILKDVLGYSLEEIADTTSSTVPAVKALLIRGRAKLRTPAAAGDMPWSARAPTTPEDRALLQKYAGLFNAHDWDGLRTLITEGSKLDLVSMAYREGKSIGGYFDRYAKEPNPQMQLIDVEGRAGLGVFMGEPRRLTHVVLIDWAAGKVSRIRDYKYAPYIVDVLKWKPLT